MSFLGRKNTDFALFNGLLQIFVPYRVQIVNFSDNLLKNKAPVFANLVSPNFPIAKELTSSPDRNNTDDIPYLRDALLLIERDYNEK